MADYKRPLQLEWRRGDLNKTVIGKILIQEILLFLSSQMVQQYALIKLSQRAYFTSFVLNIKIDHFIKVICIGEQMEGRSEDTKCSRGISAQKYKTVGKSWN